MTLEIGKFYKKEGVVIAIRGEIPTTMWGDTLIAESPSDIVGLIPIDSEADNWSEITEEEWLSYFDFEEK